MLLERPAANAAEYLYAEIGTELTELFFRPYTEKMWDLRLEDVPPSIVKRIPLRFTTDDTYFDPAEEQMLPRNGYTAIFKSIMDLPNIGVDLHLQAYDD